MACSATPVSSAEENLAAPELLVASPTSRAVDDCAVESEPPVPRGRGRWTWAAVAGLLALYAVMAFSASLSKGVSFDEGLQLAVGYNIWRNHDFRMEGANGDLVKRWATLPFLISRPKFVAADDVAWKESSPYELGGRFLFELGNKPEALLAQARAMITLLGVATGLLIFLGTRELFGAVGGLIALTLFVFSPSMLAFGGIVSTDMSITLTLFAATWCVWKLLHEITIRRVLLGFASVGLMVLAKPSALAIFPTAAVLVGLKLLRGRPLLIRWRERVVTMRNRWGQGAVFFALAGLHVFAGWSALWAHYEFRYAASPAPNDPSLRLFKPSTQDVVPVPLQRTLTWMKETHVLPEGFRRGIGALLKCDDALGSFMHGEWSLRGRRTFFPYTIWVKTPPVMMAFLVAGALALWWIWPRSSSVLYEIAPHLALIGCYLALAMAEDINIGHRHVLPIYPSLYVLSGAVAACWMRLRWTRPVVVAALGLMAADSLAVRPDYLAYFGPQAGGPANGFKHLVDSSLDWGMDLPTLRRWIDQHNPEQKEQMFLAFFGSDRPSHYGIRAYRLPGFLERRKFAPIMLAPGYYAISATLFQGVYTGAFGPWSQTYEQLYGSTLEKVMAFEKTAERPAERARLLQRQPISEWMNIYDLFDDLRFARLCAWLRHHGGPPEQVGHSILIWKLDAGALQAALVGPAAELADGPSVVRHFRTFEPK